MPHSPFSADSDSLSEDEFDTYPAGEVERRRLEDENEIVDVLGTRDTVTNTNPDLVGGSGGGFNANGHEDSFVLPILLNIDDSEDDDLELLRIGPGGYREKGARDFEEDGAGTPVQSTAGMKKRRR